MDDSFDHLCGDFPAFQDQHKDVSLGSALRVPGIEHLLHNALDQIMDHLHFFKEWFENARELGRFLGNAFYTDRLVHHCLNKPGAERIKEGVQQSIPQPYEKSLDL